MNRVFVPLVFVLTSAAATGCVAAEGDESFVIINNLVPEIDEMTGVAVFTPNIDGPFFSSGLITTDFTSFTVGSLIESRVQAAEGKESLRTIFVQGANISLDVSEVTVVNGSQVDRIGSPETIEFSIPFSAALRPNGGLGIGIYDLIPPDLMAVLRGKIEGAGAAAGAEIFINITSTTTMFADFYGDRIDSTSFVFPIVVTNGTAAAQ